MSLANESADTRMVALRLPLVPYRTPPESSMDDPEARQRHARAAPPDPPPYPRAFTSYETSLKTDVYRTVSCDPYLNNDGEALYRFLLTQSAKPPTFIVDRKSFKEFNFDKVVYGWDLGRLRDRIQKTLEDNWDADKMRGPKVKVQFNLIGNVVSVRSNSWMTHVLDHRWMKLFLCILFIYPLVIWPIRRFSAAQWHVAGAAYALARWVHLEGSSPGEGFEAFCSRTGRLATDDLAITPWGVAKLVGVTEEDWFNAWESTFVDFARRKMKADAGAVMDNPPRVN
ncbi:hypothetical protein FRB98_001153 [Tulasnella sp. 332]|nr:hypothetical protein FRB98_001153 [Tulasnella sp. 332]